MHNTQIYKNMNAASLTKRVILNCIPYEDKEVMFYQDVNAYSWWPNEELFLKLVDKGLKFAAFTDHRNQPLPDFLLAYPDILIIEEVLE